MRNRTFASFRPTDYDWRMRTERITDMLLDVLAQQFPHLETTLLSEQFGETVVKTAKELLDTYFVNYDVIQQHAMANGPIYQKMLNSLVSQGNLVINKLSKKSDTLVHITFASEREKALFSA